MNFSFLWQRARQFRGELLLISGLTLLGSLATLAVPWLAGQVLGGVVEGQPQSLGNTLVLLVAALVALTVINIVSAILSSKASLAILHRLRREVHDHVVLMPLSFHEKRSAGDTLALMTYEVSNLSSFLATTLANAPSMIVTAVGAVVLLFVLDPSMALVVPLLVPVFFVLMKLVGRRLRVLSKQARKAEALVFETAERDLAMIPAIKSFATEGHRRDNYDAVTARSRDYVYRQTRIKAFIAPLVALVAALAAIAVLVFGSSSLSQDGREPADLFSFLLYAALLTRPVGGLADIYGRFQIARGTLSRLQSVLGLPVEPGHESGEPTERAEGAIAFEGVSFAYPGRPQVIDDLDLAIAPGEIVALTGDNGVGKSTLIKLLLRFYTPDAGRITLDGSDIAALQVQDLRRQFGYVPQRPLLFNGTIAENIAFGTEVDQATLSRAVELAQASDFLARLPHGLDTEIGDHGIRLSGGQGQRIALARALYRDPPAFILDEATSMYDLESEAAFVEDCIHALSERTVIIITHRPASLALADRVLRVTPNGIVQER